MTLPLPANWTTGSVFTAVAETNVENAVNAIGAGTLCVPRHVNASAASSLTLTTSYNTYVYTGSTAAAWTLPAVAALPGASLELFNRGTGTVTVSRAGADQILSGTIPVTSIPLAPGAVVRLLDDGTYWVMDAGTAPLPAYDSSALKTVTSRASGVATTWTQTVAAGGPTGVIILCGARGDDLAVGATAAVSLGGVTLTSLGKKIDSTHTDQWLWVFAGTGIPSGTQTASVTLTQAGHTFTGYMTSSTYLNVKNTALSTFDDNTILSRFPVTMPVASTGPAIVVVAWVSAILTVYGYYSARQLGSDAFAMGDIMTFGNSSIGQYAETGSYGGYSYVCAGLTLSQ